MFFPLLVILLSVWIYYKLISPCLYWKKRGIPHVPSWPLVGNMGPIMLKKKLFKDLAMGLYNKYQNERYVGYMVFMQHCLLIKDPDLIMQIMIKNFDSFRNRNNVIESEQLFFKGLFFLNGNRWSNMRATLSPSFTISKLKKMHSLIVECAENFVKNFDGGEVEVEMRGIFSRFAGDVIASTAFGIKIDSMKEPHNEFFNMGVELTKTTFSQIIKIIMFQASRRMCEFFDIQIFPSHVTNFFRDVIRDNMKKRESEGIVRPDMIHLMMETRRRNTKETKSEDEEHKTDPDAKYLELTEDDIVAQAAIFFFAGFDTVSTALSFMAYELAISSDIQKKLQEEIDTVNEKCQGKVSYETLMSSMKYLDQVVLETLRLWPSVFEIDRVCVKNYLIEPEKQHEKPILVEKGTVITIPVMAIHMDPLYYPEPKRFDPERFNDENRKKILPGTYLPFGLGRRGCLGIRFAVLEIKTVFYHLLSKFDIVPIAKTQIPLKIGHYNFRLTPERGIWLGLKSRV